MAAVPPEVITAILKKAAEKLGGEDILLKHGSGEYFRSLGLWEQDIDEIGRILRAHLFVENYLTEHLEKTNPRLGSIQDARLTFAQKVALLDKNSLEIHEWIPGIRRLNAIRNRLAHRTNEGATEEDRAEFLSCTEFRELLDDQLPTDPIVVLEEFAKHAAMALSHEQSVVARAMKDAIIEMLPPTNDA